MKKKMVSWVLAVVFVCSLSLVASAYSVSGYASATGSISGLSFSGRASTNCPLSALESSDGEFDIYEAGRSLYYSTQHDKTSFSDSWEVRSPKYELYECYMTGNFYYLNLPEEKQTWDDSKDLRVVRSNISVDKAIYKLDSGFKSYFSDVFNISDEAYTFIQKYSEEYIALKLDETDVFINRELGDTKPVYFMNQEGNELLVLKQNAKGTNYMFTFSCENECYSLKEIKTKDGIYLDGSTLLEEA